MLKTKDSSVTNRAYSMLEIKAVDDGHRIIEGIASTPETDRVGDIVVPGGAKYTLPIPLLMQHDHGSPIGEVFELDISPKQIRFKARLASDDQPGPLKDLLDKAWRMLQKGLLRFTSIGFRVLEAEPIPGTFGMKFTSWEFLELSTVVIPANAGAKITTVKSLIKSLQVASDKEQHKSPGVSGSVSLIKPGDTKVAKKTYAEQITDLEATRKVKADKLNEITEKTLDGARTKDAAEREEFDTLMQEVDQLDGEIKDLRNLEKMAARGAKSVDDEIKVKAERPASPSTMNSVQVKNTQKLEPGIRFARFAKCLAIADESQRRGTFVTADQVAKSLYSHDDAIVGMFQKAPVAAAMTTTDLWAGNLVNDNGGVLADFVEFLRPQTIIGRFGADGIPALRRVPFRTPLGGQTTGGAGYWVGEGQAKPLTSFEFGTNSLNPTKVANIAVASMELLRDSSPSAETLIRDGLRDALQERLDIDFIDPAKAAVANTSPASITNGATAIVSSGGTADDVRADIQALFATFIAANNAPTSGVWIMSSTTALALSLMQNPLGQAEFPGLGMRGGNLFGLPVLISQHVPADTSGAIVVLANASDIYLADEGGVNISMSREASIQMNDAPDNPTTATTVLVSLWQRNLVGFLAERTISWARRRPGAVAYLTGVTWGSGA